MQAYYSSRLEQIKLHILRGSAFFKGREIKQSPKIGNKRDAGMSVETVPAVVNIKTLKGRFIAHKFSTGWAVGVVQSVEKKKSVAGQFAVKYKRIRLRG